MDPMDANDDAVASPPSLLLPFYQYLVLRVQSQNVKMLKRIVEEFLCDPQCLPTVESMLRLTFPVVALVPVDIDDSSKRTQADVILSCMKFIRKEDVRRAKLVLKELYETLSTKIQLKNWDWLDQIFRDFCRGEEHCLVEFVRLQRQSISIIPVVPMLGGEAYQPHYSSKSKERPMLSVAPPSSDGYSSASSESSAREAHRQAKTVHVHKAPEDETNRDLDRRATTKDTRNSNRLRIVTAIRHIERTQPWKVIFDVSRIEYPFDDEEHRNLSDNLMWFWETHAQAVWERLYWYPKSALEHGDNAAYERLQRQERAANAFIAKVIVPAYEQLGPQFFVDLDNSTQPCYWWWYRRPFVNIISMGNALGLKTCLAYLRSSTYERFPDPPKGFAVRAERHSVEPVSMWSTHVTEAKILKKIERLKKKTKNHTNVSEYATEDY